jgi:hypothetical protein
MIDYQDPQYRLEDLDDDGSQYLVKVQIVSLDSVDVTQEPSGEIIFTPKLQPVEEAEGGDKYRLYPEGGMFRLYAKRHVRSGVEPGDRGGLVGNDSVLSQDGSCWVAESARVAGCVSISGDAYVGNDCHIDAGASITDRVYLHGVSVDSEGGGYFEMAGSLSITDTRLSARGATLFVNGHVTIDDSLIEITEDLIISGCLVTHGHIRNQFELQSIHHNEYRWLSAYRSTKGTLMFKIGCQVAYSAGELISLAREFNVSDLEREMLDHFLALVAQSRRGWKDYVAPVEAPKSQDDTASEVPATSEPSFSDLAQRAREAVHSMNPPPVPPAARLEQCGAEVGEEF